MFIGTMALAAVSASAYAGLGSHALHPYLAMAVLALATVTSRMKVKLPGVHGNMSVNLPFLLTAVVNLSAAEAILITCASTAVQCWPRKNARINPQQMIFNVSMMALAGCLACLIFHSQWLRPTNSSTLGLVLATATLFLAQTAPVAAVVALSEGTAAPQIWWNLAQLSFPYYLVSAGVASMMQTVNSHMGWGLALAMFPVMYGIHRSYALYFSWMTETVYPQHLVRAARAGA
ncbi:MAG TPA: hypothetical protein VFE61_15635 [Candidatus Sulfotelmatobacter sp.]|nr:hypothetical protein [Candidatus Sulfotelmatobacter sp.]